MAYCLTLSRKNAGDVKTALLGFLLILGMTLFGLSSMAQSLSIASLDAEGVIQLPINQPIASNYSFDASALSFESNAALFRFFDALNNDTFLIRVNPENMEGHLMLRTKNRSSWTVEQWNDALRQHCEARPIRTNN